MSRKQFTAERIIGLLREAEVGLSQGKKVGEMGIPSRVRDELLNRELLFPLKEAKVVIEN